MWGVRYLPIYLAAIATLQESEGYRVLFVCCVTTKSHYNFYQGIIKEFADSGNHVTVITPYASKDERRDGKIREVLVPEGDVVQTGPNRFNMTMMTFLQQMQTLMPICVESMGRREVQNLRREKFDVVLLSPFNDCYLSLVQQLEAPLVYVSPYGLTSNTAEVVGNPIFPSYVTTVALDYTYPLTFAQRTKNVLAGIALNLLFNYYMRPNVRELETPPRPYITSVIHLGGIHCRPAEPLPKDLSDWVEGAGEDGFVYFSLGTAIKSIDLSESHRKILTKAFRSLKQRVLWKWDDDSIPGMPPNVRVAKWLPQQDILGHPKLRLFITHGGLLSTLESVYHGRPVLGMPVFGDQMGNMKEVERQGWGKMVPWNDLTEGRLVEEIISVMNNKTMHEVVASKSRLMRDQPMTPKERLLFWTGYVIRHKGAEHLRSPIAQMPWYKVYNVDVWMTLVALCALITWLFCRISLSAIRFLLRNGKAKRD
ncbi:UDP-glucuronosyltransferase 2B13-like isoform X2 [Macrobrachium nipponense]|uniref:UDP-glucuronosyltransferase 2B13-like isoform X2 n=1 Tax=Macrobrachium nipponense TaxID=159736 RepID=UPI0030C87636